MRKAIGGLLLASLSMSAYAADAAPSSLGKYAGTYVFNDDFKLGMREDGGQLWMRAAMHPCYLMAPKDRRSQCDLPHSRLGLMQWMPLTDLGNGLFAFNSDDLRLTFQQDPRGRITHVRMHQQAGHMMFPHPAGADLDFVRLRSTVKLPPAPQQILLPAQALAQFAGTYLMNPDVDVHVEVDGDHLNTRSTDGAEFRLFPESANHFFTRMEPTEVSFERGQDGHVIQARWYQNGTVHVLKRQPDAYVARLSPLPAVVSCKGSPLEGARNDLERGTLLVADKVKSALLGRDVPICVYLPPGYADGNGDYPVIYQADAELFITSLARQMEDKKVQAIVVGLGDLDHRDINLVPPGAEKYFRFVIDEVMPQIESRYRIDKSRRMLSGHSFGGYFVLAAALMDTPEHPHFSYYASSDGSFWSAPEELDALMNARRKQSARFPVSILMAGAGHGNGVYVRNAYQHMVKAHFKDLDLDLLDLKDDDHDTITHVIVSEALSRFFAPGVAPLPNVALSVDGELPSRAQALNYLGSSIYMGEVSLTAGTHSLALSAGPMFGVAPDTAQDLVAADGRPIALRPGGRAWTVTVPAQERYVVRLNASNRAVPVLAIAPKVSAFAEQAIYLRGSMNNWGVTNPMQRLDADHYAVDVAMKAGANELKVATEDFQTINYGAAAGQKSMVFGSPKSLTQGGSNVALSVDSDGTYTATLDISRPSEPALSITRKTF
jgi:predicted alpha/beta superfamily hydrolase